MKKVVLILIILISVFCFIGIFISINNGVKLAKLNFMNEDIDVLEDKIALYYLNFGNIPIEEKVEFHNSINPNDSENFYKIDINRLDNIYLNYGNENYGENDYYIINDKSHTIYYLKGIEYKNNKYYTKDVKYTLVEQK